MAIDFNVPSAPSNNAGNDSWKAQAFLNAYIRRPDSSKIKIGEKGIPLKQSRKWDALFIERMSKEGAISALMEVVELEFVLVDDKALAADALGF